MKGVSPLCEMCIVAKPKVLHGQNEGTGQGSSRSIAAGVWPSRTERVSFLFRRG